MKQIFAVLLLVIASQTAFSDDGQTTLEITKLERGVYLHRSYQTIEGYGRVGSNGLIVIAENKAYVIDTPWSDLDTSALADWIKRQGYEFIASLSTHSHADRAGSIGLLNALPIKTFASSLTNTLLENKGLTAAKYSFSNKAFSLVPDTIEAHYHGAGHTQDNLVVWLPKVNLLFGGCLVRSLDAKTLGNVREASIDQWEGTIDNLLHAFPQTKIVVPGHGKIGNKDLLTHTKVLANKAAAQ